MYTVYILYTDSNTHTVQMIMTVTRTTIVCAATPNVGATYCTPEINTSEILVDLLRRTARVHATEHVYEKGTLSEGSASTDKRQTCMHATTQTICSGRVKLPSHNQGAL